MTTLPGQQLPSPRRPIYRPFGLGGLFWVLGVVALYLLLTWMWVPAWSPWGS